MKLSSIVQGLSALPSGQSAETQARMGFLEWSMSLEPDENPRAAAQLATARMHSFVCAAPALTIFRDLLAQAARPNPFRPVRRGGARGRRRVIH